VDEAGPLEEDQIVGKAVEATLSRPPNRVPAEEIMEPEQQPHPKITCGRNKDSHENPEGIAAIVPEMPIRSVIDVVEISATVPALTARTTSPRA
jgi:hypothetical protein